MDTDPTQWHESVPKNMQRDELPIHSDTAIERHGSLAGRYSDVLIGLSVSAIPVLYLAYYIYSFSSALPVNDQWDVAPFIVSVKEGHPDLRQLFHFHNEHFIVIPRLLFAGLALLFTWDNRAECWVTFVLTATTFSFLSRLVLKAQKRDQLASLVALVVIAVFLFSTTQWQNWLWGFQLAWPIPVLALTAAIPSLYRSRGTVVVIIAASMAAVLSMGSGFMVPLILFVILGTRYFRSRDRPILPGLALCGCLTALAVGFFLTNKPPGAGVIHIGTSSLQGIAILLANPFLDYTRSVPESLSLFFLFAFGVSAVLIALFILFSVRGYQVNAFATPIFATGFALGAWALLSVTAIALARAQWGFEGLTQSRYITYALLLPVGLLLMAVALMRSKELPASNFLCRAWMFLAVGLATLSLRGEASRLQWGRDMAGVYSTLSEFVKVAPAFAIDGELQKICPQTNRLGLVEAVTRNRLIRGMVPLGKHVPASMLQMQEPIGNIDAIVATESGSSDLTGWCGFLDARGIPDAVFVGTPNADGSVELIAPILERHRPRPDVAAQGGPLESGWQLHLSAEYGGKAVTLFAYDWASNRFYQGSGTKRLGVMSAEREVEVERVK
jgi:hypothetical protein